MKEWTELVRDKVFLALAFLIPSILMFLFGFGLNLNVENMPLTIIDHDLSSLSREYSNKFISSRYFEYRGHANDYRDVDELIQSNELRAVIEIPSGFERNILRGEQVKLQTVIDGTFPARAQLVKGYVSAINAQFNLKLAKDVLTGMLGVPSNQADHLINPIQVKTRYFFNQAVDGSWSIIPKLIMILLMISPPFLTVIGIIREKERGSIFNIYSSNVTKSEFLIGKISPYVLISFVNSLTLFSLVVWLFEIPFKGSFGTYLLGSFLYVICTTGIGLVISVLVETQIAAMMISIIVTLLPSVSYSGLLFPVNSFNTFSKVIAYMLPTMYYREIIDATFLKGEGLKFVWQNLLMLVVYIIVLFGIGYASFTKRPKS